MALDDVVNAVKLHVVDATALLVVSHPVYGAMETYIAGMDDEVSLISRLIITGISYLGFASLISRGRDFSRSFFGISDETKERFQVGHDMVYNAVFNLVANPLIYLAAGSRDVQEIAVGSLSGAAIGLTFGGLFGYSLDAYRDLFGLKSTNRLPDLVAKQSSSRKKAIAFAGMAVSTALLALVYVSTPDSLELF